jgi:UDP-N-acetylglucosamine 2-epimerase (non-hydrolysing)
MVDALEFNKEIAEKRSGILERLGITKEKYLVLTVHRPANTDSR